MMNNVSSFKFLVQNATTAFFIIITIISDTVDDAECILVAVVLVSVWTVCSTDIAIARVNGDINVICIVKVFKLWYYTLLVTRFDTECPHSSPLHCNTTSSSSICSYDLFLLVLPIFLLLLLPPSALRPL